MQIDNGLFWIDFGSVCRHFHAIYFNWNPDLFSYRAVTHGAWPVAAPGPENDRITVGDNPQCVKGEEGLLAECVGVPCVRGVGGGGVECRSRAHVSSFPWR
jgi:hypothetical protein